jgi:ferredoxin
MAKQINQNRCIQCNACLPETPSEGVTVINTVFVIDPRLCSECAGLYARSLCSTAYPTDTVDAGRRDDSDIFRGRATHLHRRRLPRD